MKTLMALKTCVVAAVVAIGIGARAFGAWPEGMGFFSPRHYEQNGLVLSWDGICNAGADKHDAAAKKWIELTGSGKDWTLSTGGSWAADGLVFSGDATAASLPNGSFANKMTTMEFVWTTSEKKHGIILNPGFDSRSCPYFYTDTSGRVGIAEHYGATATTNEPNCFSAVYARDGAKPSGVKSQWLNGETHANDGMGDWWSVGGNVTLGSRNNQPFAHGILHMMRVYDRELTDEERALNYKIDQARFCGVEPTDTLVIAANDESVVSTPAFGIYMNLADGATKPVTVPDVVTNAAKTVVTKCKGWTLYDFSGNVVDSDDGNVCEYEHPTPAAARRLEWTFEYEYLSRTFVWTGAGEDNLASNGDNWDLGFAPSMGAVIVLDGVAANGNKDMTWDLDVPLASWTQDGYTGTVTIATVYDPEGFDCLEVAGDVTLKSGTWTHLSNVDAAKDTYHLRVDVGGAFTLATNEETGVSANINAKGFGYPKNYGYSAGEGGPSDRGGSHGGSSFNNPSRCYGSIKLPTETGAAGSGGSKKYNGGGAVYITAKGDAVIDGEINVDGTGNYYGTETSSFKSGSGGSILIRANTVTGGGALNARGCQRWYSHSGGGGGRIALYATAANATHEGFISNVSVDSSAGGNAATGGTVYYEVPGDNRRGVLKVSGYGKNTSINYVSQGGNTMFRTSVKPANNDELAEGFSKIILEKYARFSVDAGAVLDLTDTEIVTDGTCWFFVWGTVESERTLVIPDLYVYTFKGAESPVFDAPLVVFTNVTMRSHQTTAPVVFTHDVAFVGTSAVGHCNSEQEGGFYALKARDYKILLDIGGDLFVDAAAKIDATGWGTQTSTSCGYPGVADGNGVSYGGLGQTTVSPDGTSPCWGSVYAPTLHGGKNAGEIRIVVAGKTRIDGRLASVGGCDNNFGGSGGSIRLATETLVGTGLVSVAGGYAKNKNSCGGGGRFALTLTGAGATEDDFDGDIVAFGRGKNEGTQITRAPNVAMATQSGAGTIWVRHAGEAETEGTLYVDQGRTDGNVDAHAVTEFLAGMTDTSFGRIVVRKGGILKGGDGTTLVTSVFSNDASVVFAPSSTVRLVPDAQGNAYLYGDMTFANLIVDPTVETLYCEAGKTIGVTASFTARGADAEHRICLRSTSGGTRFLLNVDAAAIQALDYLDVADSDATAGANLMAQHSVGDSTAGWTFENIEPGTKFSWTGAADSTWGNAANWALEDGSVSQRAPVETDLIVINASAHDPVLPQKETTLSNLTVKAGATLSLSGFGLIVTGDAAVYGTLATTADETVTFGGDVDFTADGGRPGVFVANGSTVVVANDEPATLDFAGLTFSTLRVANSAVATLVGGFSTTYLRLDAGSDLAIAPSAPVEATALFVTGEADRMVTLRSATETEAYAFTVKGYAEVACIDVSDADSSAGVEVFAAHSQGEGRRNVNWNFNDTRKVWTGAKSSAFLTADNWKDGVAPENGADVVIAVDAARTMEITTDGVELNSLVVQGPGAKLSKEVSIAKSLALISGTLTIDRPLAVGTSVYMADGAVITHTAQGNSDEKQYFCELNVGGDVVMAAGAKVDVRAKGYPSGRGRNRVGTAYRASGGYGGVGGVRPELNNTWGGIYVSYGSVFAPTDYGSTGGGGGPGGGAFALRAAGKVTLNGTIDADAYQGSSDCHGAAGGSVYIRAGELIGTGTIVAQGMAGNNAYSGGGGRVSLVLTKPGSDFSGFSDDVSAYGGVQVNSTFRVGGAGTVYRQTGDQGDGTGTIYLSNGTQGKMNQYNYCLTGFGFPGMEDLSKATVEIGPNGGIYLFGDAKIGKLRFNGATAAYPAGINFNGYTLTVKEPCPPKTEWTFDKDGNTKYKFDNVYNGSIKYRGRDGSNLQWQTAGFVLRVR